MKPKGGDLVKLNNSPHVTVDYDDNHWFVHIISGRLVYCQQYLEVIDTLKFNLKYSTPVKDVRSISDGDWFKFENAPDYLPYGGKIWIAVKLLRTHHHRFNFVELYTGEPLFDCAYNSECLVATKPWYITSS